MKFVTGAVLDAVCGRFYIVFICDGFCVGDTIDDIGNFKLLVYDGLRKS